jgi:hypothetical protein
MKYLPEWLSAEGFNSYYPLAWGSTQYKPNGVIFLEPSLLSLLPAIAIVYTLSRTFGAGPSRIREIVWLIPLSLGIAISASASGLVVLLPCTLVLLVGIRKNGSVAVALALLALLASFAGIFDSVIEKAGEGVSGQTSTGLRLVYPYQALAPAWLERPLFGHGSGAVTEYVAESGLVALQASTLMKALVEYGAVGTAVIGAVLVRLMMASQAPAAVKVAGVCAWLLPADNLVSPVLVGLMLFALPQWPCFDGALRDAPPVKVGRGLSGKTLGELSTVRLW